MVKKSVLDQFIKRDGYKIVKKSEDGLRWENTTEAEEKTGLSRMTINRLLKEYPTEPSKGLPKYVGTFENSEGYKLFKEKYGARKTFDEKAQTILKAWLWLDKNGKGQIDPANWTEEHYRLIWQNPDFRREGMDDIVEQYGVPLRNLMKVTKKTEFLLMFHSSKFGKGKKKEWFLEDGDIMALCGVYDRLDCLVMLGLGINKGARFSSLVLSEPQQFNIVDSVQADFEPKMQKKGGIAYVSRFIIKAMMDFVQKYIKDCNIQPNERLFKESYSFYYTYMLKMGRKAGFAKNISTHILKHTFVTQASRHAVSAEVVSEQTGTDFSTLQQHYRARDERKLRHELLGEKLDVVPFPKWLGDLMPHFEQAYERIRKQGAIR